MVIEIDGILGKAPREIPRRGLAPMLCWILRDLRKYEGATQFPDASDLMQYADSGIPDSVVDRYQYTVFTHDDVKIMLTLLVAWYGFLKEDEGAE